MLPQWRLGTSPNTSYKNLKYSRQVLTCHNNGFFAQGFLGCRWCLTIHGFSLFQPTSLGPMIDRISFPPSPPHWRKTASAKKTSCKAKGFWKKTRAHARKPCHAKSERHWVFIDSLITMGCLAQYLTNALICLIFHPLPMGPDEIDGNARSR